MFAAGDVRQKRSLPAGSSACRYLDRQKERLVLDEMGWSSLQRPGLGHDEPLQVLLQRLELAAWA